MAKNCGGFRHLEGKEVHVFMDGALYKGGFFDDYSGPQDAGHDFSFSFRLHDSSMLEVVISTDGGAYAAVDPGDYTVALNTDQYVSPGGTVTYTPALAANETLRIRHLDEVYSAHEVQTVAGDHVSVPDLFYGTVRCGLTYTATGKTLPVSFEVAAASRGTVKTINKVFVRANGEGTLKIGPTSDKLVDMVVDSTSAGEIPPMKEVPVLGDWNGDACLHFEHDYPGPFMLQSMVIEVVTGG